MGVPPGNSSRGTAGLVSVPERYVAGADTRGRQEGRPYPWSQQVIHEISGLRKGHLAKLKVAHDEQFSIREVRISHGSFKLIHHYRLHLLSEN
jgi:hypothetical protein